MMNPESLRRLRSGLGRLPLVSTVVGALKRRRLRRRMSRLPAEQVFAELVEGNLWHGRESRSGAGSDPEQTRKLVAELPRLLRELGVRTLLDVPCGDFRWMRNVDLEGIRYLGGDIVEGLVERNRAFAGESIRFERLDLLNGPLPSADLVLCRDCLVHFSFADVRRALATLVASGSRWLLTTTFPEHSASEDIVTGEWRPLNLELPPFRFPPPVRLLVEGCTEGGGAYADKSLGLWRLDEIAACLANRERGAERRG